MTFALEGLVAEDWAGAAWFLGCGVPEIRAVARVEAPRGGYLPTGEPTILFERHVFSELTSGVFDGARAPDLPDRYSLVSSPQPSYLDKSYGPESKQHARLAAAADLNRTAALKAASWGAFQIMGFNYARAGHGRLQDFINGMYNGGASEQLRCFCCFVRSDQRLVAALRGRDWETFALLYNGTDYARTNYHGRIAEAYAAETAGDRRA